MAVVVNADIYKQIDRINKRIQKIAEANEMFNTDLLLQKYHQVLSAVVPPNLLKQGKYGLTISKSKEAQSTLTQEQLKRIESMETIGEFKQELLQAAMEETGKTAEGVTIEDMKEVSDDIQTVRDAEDMHGKINYNADDAGFMQEGGTKSYKELAAVVRRYQAQLAQEQKTQNKVVADYDAEHITSRASKASRRSGASDKVR